MVTYEIVGTEDFDEILDFYVKNFCGVEALSVTLEMTADEAVELFGYLLKGTENLIARDNGKIIGVQTLKKHEMNEIPKAGFQGLGDYGEVMDAGPLKHRKNNLLLTLFEAIESPIFEKFETPCTFYRSLFGAILPSYYGSPEIIINGVKFCTSHALKNGAKYFFGISSTQGSIDMHLKLPGTVVANKFEYSSFKDYGTAPFERVVGGNQYAYIFLVDLEKHRNYYE